MYGQFFSYEMCCDLYYLSGVWQLFFSSLTCLMVVSAAMRHAVYDGIDGFGAEVSGEALTVALDVVQAWAVVLTLGFTIVLFFFLAFCVCSRKEDR